MKTKYNTINIVWALFAVFLFSTKVQAKVVLTDIFERELNDTYVVLVDRQGHLMNPMAKLKLVPPTEVVTFPLEVKIKDIGISRLMLDLQRALLEKV
jgi:hypothetical protein